jgi:phage-related baseplate assembly protein
MNRIDLSKLPAPALIDELDFEVILGNMRDKMRELCPEWTGYELESDPANKVMEVAAYREMLIRQRVNEAARGVMMAFASGSDLDHLAAFYPETRLPGAAAFFTAVLKLSAPLDVAATIHGGFTVVAKNGAIEAQLVETVMLSPGETEAEGVFEVIKPLGSEGNGLSLAWDAVTPLPFVVKVEQTEPARGGSDSERDGSFRTRAPESLHRHSTAGAWGAYRYHAKSADARIRDADAWSPERGHVTVAVLSADGDGAADEMMLRRVQDKLSDEDARPGTDLVTVISAEVIHYSVSMTVEMYPGVAGAPPYEEARRRVAAKATELYGLGMDVPLDAFRAAAYVNGVKRVIISEPQDDIHIGRHQAAWCEAIEMGSAVADAF